MAGDKAQPVALFLCAAFTPHHLSAVALEPFLDLGRVGIARRVDRYGERFDRLAGRRAASGARVARMATGTGGRLRFAAGKRFAMEAFAARSRESGKRRRLSARCGGILGKRSSRAEAVGVAVVAASTCVIARASWGTVGWAWSSPRWLDMPPLCPAVAERLLKRVFMLRSAIPA